MKDNVKVVIFAINEREYAMDIHAVKEVIRFKRVTPVPGSQEYIEGVISRRGKTITVLNLSGKLTGLQKPPKEKSRVILALVKGQAVGIIVDSINEVKALAPQEISDKDSFIARTGYVTGVTRLGERVVFLIDIEKALSEGMAEHISNVERKVEIRSRK